MNLSAVSPFPKVSVLMPVRDGLPYLDKAIRSILTQTFRDFEFIIVDDGSTDGTAATIEHWAKRDSRIRTFLRPAEGHYLALNFSLSQANGEYVARMDADDVSLPDRFELQVAMLDAAPQVVAVGGQTWAMDQDDELLFAIHCPTDSKEIEASLFAGRNCLSHPTMMMRKSIVTQAGNYRDDSPTEDYGLWLRMLELGAIGCVPQFVLHYRLHANPSRIAKHATQQQITRRLLTAAHARRGTPLPPLPASDHAPQSVARIHHHWAMSAVRAGFWKTARKHAWCAIRLEPGNLHGWWTLFKTIVHLRGLGS